MGRPSRQKVNKATVVLNDTIEQLDLIDIYRTFHPKTRMHILFRCAWNILQDRTNAGPQNKSQQIQVERNHIKHFFPNHSGMKLKISHRKKIGKVQTHGN